MNCVIIDPDPANRQELTAFLQSHGIASVSAVARIDALDAALRPAAGAQPIGLVIVHIDPNPHDAINQLAPIIRQHPQVNFFVMSETLEAGLVLDAMHAGVKEFVTLPVNQQKFRAAIERVAQLQGLDKRAKVLHFIPSMGGCGSTTIACNVAASLARNAKTVLIDLDLVRGAVGNAFDVRPRYSIADLMDPTTELDGALLDNALAVHRSSGLAILARPELPEDAQRITKQGVQRLLTVVSRLFDYVLIDSQMSADAVYQPGLQGADMNILVMQLNVPSARNTERFMGTMRRMGLDPEKIKVVVNRTTRKGYDIDAEEVERALGTKIAWSVPNDFKNAITAINYGQPVVLRSPRAEMSDSL
ncbi:MAG: pilus assembly protein CpaE, partial [Humisphaera sp.]|nr:pilus assembly protein CpaE [Humisphaera sp.]